MILPALRPGLLWVATGLPLTGTLRVCRGDAATARERRFDFITGEGTIAGTPTGARGTLALSGGVTGEGFWGQFTYVDEGTGMTVNSTGVTAYRRGATDNSRYIEGTAEIDGVGGYTYAVEVTDNGESGREDTFSVVLSNGYRAGGLLVEGNVQLQQPCR